MALHFRVSNNLDALATAMIQEGYANLDIFQPLLLITQTKGMNNWLIQKIASEIGIAMNVQFVQPAQFVADIYQLLVTHKKKTISRNNIDWLLFQALSEPNFKYRFPIQYDYFVENEKENDVKKWELAAKVADLFDQYQIYRHQTIQEWNQQKIKDSELKFEWQYYLWNRIKEIAGDQFPDMTEMQTKILEALEIPEKIELVKNHFPKISLFGVSIITPFHIQIFYKLKDHIDFYFYLLNPAPEHLWEYDKSEKDASYFPADHQVIVGNPLLTGWGKILQHTSKILFNDDAIFNLREEIAATEPSRNSLLSKIQNDIFNNNVADIHFDTADLQDKSVQITSVYTVHSEVETLYNYLLQIVSNNELADLTERDILIIVTDINKYAPYIKAVFENAPYKFNYTIADENIDSGDSMVGALMALLAIEATNFTAEHLLSLLDFSYIRKKFGITDIDFLRQVVQTTGIRFGIENSEIDDTFLVSWEYGLKKMMYGICFEEATLFEYQGKEWMTMDVADNNHPIQQIVRLTAFVNQLILHLEERKKPRNLNAWKLNIENLVLDFLESPQLDTEDEIEKWLQQINQYEYIDDLIQNNDISFEVFGTRLKNYISNETQSGKYLNKGITFCSPLPFRSIPFRIIGFLGLHMDSFPRKEKSSDYDLIKNEFHIGDRNIKENDKHLFLESILSAQSRLYLSYIGKSVKDNSHIPPSIVIDELLDYIQSGFDYESGVDVRAILISQRPLQTYNSAYNKAGSTLLPNYFIQKEKPYPIQVDQKSEPNQKENDRIGLRDLESFATNAIRYYYNKALRIYFRDTDESIEETEVFEVDSLSNSIIRNQLFKAYLIDEATYEKEVQTYYLNAQLPLKNRKEQYISELFMSISKLGNLFKKLSGQPLEIHSFLLAIADGRQLEGKIENIAERTLYHFSFKDEIREKAFLLWYIQYLAGSAAGLLDKAILISPKKAYHMPFISKEVAMERLEILIPVAFNAQTTLHFFSTELPVKEIKLDNFENSIESIVNGNYFYDDYTTLAVQKSLHIGKMDEYISIRKLLFDNAWLEGIT